MPIYEYQATDPATGCAKCSSAFECIQRISDPPFDKCPCCLAPIQRLISAPSVGTSKSGLDQRAKAAGFTKLSRVGKGEYEKKY